MIGPFIDGTLLILVTVFVHAAGAVFILRMMLRKRAFWDRHTHLLIETLGLGWVVGTLVIVHILEVSVWALYYLSCRVLPDWETAFYFSLATYTTVGYGDVVLGTAYRNIGGCEAIVGILMVAWSTAILLDVVSKFHDKQIARFKAHHPDA